MRVKKVVAPVFAMSAVGMGLLFGCHGEMHIGDTTPVSSVASAPPPPPPAPEPAPTPSPVAETPPPPPRIVHLKGVQTKGSQIDIPGDIEFAVNSDAINTKSKGTMDVLNAVLKIMQDNPQITALRIEGHTDSDGGDTVNKPLSDKRAAAVVKWLTSNGVDAGRLHSVGFGAQCPLVPNTTAANKAQNRRTEFRLEQMSNQPVPEDQKDANGCSVHTAAATAGGASPAAPAASASAAPAGGTAPAGSAAAKTTTAPKK